MKTILPRAFLGLLAILMAVFLSASPALSKQAMTDAEIKRAIIQQSLSEYPGNCPCPYNTDRAGRSCGRRSAYSRAGGYAPLCYPDDVTPEMIEQYRQRRQQE
jgi:hypothetical protein